MAIDKDIDGTPYCRRHHVRMKSFSGGAKDGQKTYYRCPVKDCDEKGVKVRSVQLRAVPAAPTFCGECSRGPSPQSVVCCRDDSTSGPVVLVCPVCGWRSTAYADPGLIDRPRPKPAEILGARG